MHATTTQTITPTLLFFFLVILTTSRVVYPDGLWPMNAFGQFSAQNQQIIAYYDFNRDRFVDILTRISTTGYQLQLYLWDEQARTFAKGANVNMQLFKPVQAIPVSLIKPNAIDLLLTLQLPEQETYKVVLYSMSCTSLSCEITNNPNIQPFDSKTFPTVMQLNGENIIVNSDQGIKLQVMKHYNGTLEDQDFVSQYFSDPTDEVRERVCGNYMEIFYLDYNGDCYQDIIIHCKPESGMADLQFYRGDEKGKFKTEYRASVNSPMKLLNVAIVDINFDGLVDIVELISSATGELYFEIHYNTAVKEKYQICKITLQTKTQTYFPFHFIGSESELDQDGVLQIQRFYLQLNNPEWSIDKLTPQNFYLRPGDINNDGYTDFIIDGPNKAELVINSQCLDQFCGTYNIKFMEKWPLGTIRVFLARKIDGMANYNGKICKMSFFDIHEDGRMDIFTNICPIDNMAKQNSGKILAVYNALPIDAFFIKINVLENLMNDKVVSLTMDKKLNVYGAHADYYVTALTGERISACGNQLSHPGRSLELPYIHSGLGRTNNYVQQVSVTLSGKDQVLLKTWTPIVPNSQMIIVPGPKWVLQTYISPTAVITILFWFVVLILILLGVWIARLTRKQKIQDKQNQDSFYTILR